MILNIPHLVNITVNIINSTKSVNITANITAKFAVYDINYVTLKIIFYISKRMKW
jgi:hypothetical protein